jgi:uncharacterized caspase-like protein
VAEKRVALVVGNSAYVQAGALPNPMNDASDMAEALKKVGFEVLLGLDLTKSAFDSKVRDFARALEQADVAVCFYAAHGPQAEAATTWCRSMPGCRVSATSTSMASASTSC